MHGTDTSGMVPTRDLDIEDEATKWQSNLYLGSPARVTRYIIDALDIDPADYTFIDYGSGKGRALFVAAQQPFRKVVGVEISEQLHRVAENNLTRYVGTPLKSEIELWCGNALDYPLTRRQPDPAHVSPVRAGRARADAGKDKAGSRRLSRGASWCRICSRLVWRKWCSANTRSLFG